MGANITADTYQAPAAETAKNPSPEAAAALTAQARQPGVVTRAAAEPEKKDENRPAWLPEKFKTPEDMAKSYTELEKKLGQQSQQKQTPPAKTEEKKPAGLDSLKAPEKAAETAVEKAGLDMTALNTEYAQNGDLSEQSYKQLEAAGISKEMVTLYVEGQKALQERLFSDLYSVAGGQEKFGEMHAWMSNPDNLSPEEGAALNATIATGNHKAIKLAFEGIHAKWLAAGQSEPERQLRGGNGSGPTGDVYAHRDEIMKDMKNPEYHTNEAFRQKVAEKIKRSKVW